MKRFFRLDAGSINPPCARAWRRGPAVTRPLDGVALEVLKVAQEQLPFVSKNPLLEIVPEDQPRKDVPRRLGIVLSGGPAPGGHNVIAGLYHAAKRAHPDSQVIGFLAGPKGIITDKHVEITDAMVVRVSEFRRLSHVGHRPG